MSPSCRILAMLRWTKTSPGWRPRIVVSGQRESEQPIQRIWGDWPEAREGRSVGCVAVMEARQLEFEARREVKDWESRAEGC
jgi:hypothetical protein